MGRNEGRGRTHAVDKINTEGNSHEGKTGNLEGGGLVGEDGFTRVERIMVLDGG